MLHYGKFLVLTTLVALMPCLAARAQHRKTTGGPNRATRSGATRTVEPSDLAKDNLLRVAASSAQIQSVLARDAGILVELKAWVAKEATDNGQVVDDSLLTDLAIFDRLDRDVEFRSVATRMVQRYGYLLPSVNPDSEIAKQQELVLKERAHIMAQRQDQEQAALLAAAESERKQQQEQARVERTACDPRNQSTCNGPGVAGRGTAGSFQGDITIPDMTMPIMPDQMSPSSSQRTLRRILRRPVGLWRAFKYGFGSDAGFRLCAVPVGRRFKRRRRRRYRRWYGDGCGYVRWYASGRYGWSRRPASPRQP